MTPADIKSMRKTLGLSAERFARLTGTSTGRTVRRWEAGGAPVPQSVVKLLELRAATLNLLNQLDENPTALEAVWARNGVEKILAIPQ